MTAIDLKSSRNDHIKSATQLRRRKHRNLRNRTLIDGVRELSRALDAGFSIVEAFFCPSLCQSPEAQALLERLEQLEVTRYRVTPQLFQKLAFGDRAEGVLAVAEVPTTHLESLELPERPLVAVLEGVEKPGNLGAVFRSAEAAGVSAVILADGRTDIFNPAAIRASLGAVFCLCVGAGTSDEVLAWLRQQNLTMFAARVDGSVPYTEVDFSAGSAIILGSEEAGLTSAWTADDISAVRLPMAGRIDSLNVSTTAAVLFYEAHRQRQVARGV